MGKWFLEQEKEEIFSDVVKDLKLGWRFTYRQNNNRKQIARASMDGFTSKLDPHLLGWPSQSPPRCNLIDVSDMFFSFQSFAK